MTPVRSRERRIVHCRFFETSAFPFVLPLESASFFAPSPLSVVDLPGESYSHASDESLLQMHDFADCEERRRFLLR